jgi:hypothetical protein
MSINIDGKGLIIHHWDADGICSACLLLETLKNKDIDNRTPQIGNYFLRENELEEYSGYDSIIIVDMALPAEDILRLSRTTRVTIFDHHLQTSINQVNLINPITEGASPSLFPSASWVVNDFLKNGVNLYALLGIVGDREHKIRENETFWPIISDYCKTHSMEFEDLLQMTQLIDTNYKMGDKKGVESVPHQLLEKSEPSDILGHNLWNRNMRLLKDEIERHVKAEAEEEGKVMIKWINTRYNIISTVTRRLAWGAGRNVVVINNGFFEEEDQVYARSPEKDMSFLIQRGVKQGFRAGGKKDVLGAIVPKSETARYVEEIIAYLK